MSVESWIYGPKRERLEATIVVTGVEVNVRCPYSSSLMARPGGVPDDEVRELAARLDGSCFYHEHVLPRSWLETR